jgi:hypothetical protein
MTKAERIAHGSQLKAEARARKLHVIAERRAKAVKLDKAEYIRQIVQGIHRPITAEDIAAEPDPGVAAALT